MLIFEVDVNSVKMDQCQCVTCIKIRRHFIRKLSFVIHRQTQHEASALAVFPEARICDLMSEPSFGARTLDHVTASKCPGLKIGRQSSS